MKNSKYLMLAAIAAATAMVSSCSDNDVLEGVKDTGIPFSVTASTNSGGSRGSDITTLSNFQLWGFGTDQESHFDGDNFTPKAGSTTVFVSSDNTPNWPNTSNCLFYGISNNTSTMAYGVDAGSPGINTTKLGIRNGSFDYTIPTNVADQEDLLVAAATGNSNDGVHLKFDHALTAAKMHLILDPRYTNYVDDPEPYYWILKIRKITIKNIKVSGTYTFDGATKNGDDYENGDWNTNDGTLGDYVIDLSTSPLLIQQYKGGIADVEVGGNIYFIPQTVTKWDITPNNGADMTLPATDSYIEFEAMAGIYAPNKVAEYLRVLCGWEKIEESGEEAAATNGFYHNNVKVADLEGNIVDDTDEAIDFYKRMYGGSDPDLSYFEELLEKTVGWSKDANGFYYNNIIVAESNGKVIDFSNEAINDNSFFGEQPTLETYNFVDFSGVMGTYSDLDNDNNYGILYKPFNATLNINGNRVIKVNMDRAVRTDASGAFGEGSSFEG